LFDPRGASGVVLIPKSPWKKGATRLKEALLLGEKKFGGEKKEK